MFKVKNSGRKIKNKKAIKQNKIGHVKTTKIKTHWQLEDIKKEKKKEIKKPKEIFENFK
tara:strand:- start:122 stop:298 length:177 start_codon:yes stop_codon:yes gene_type:complete